MKIYISTGRGEGATPLSAFDAALKDAGVYNYNLLVLSSIIPAHSEIVLEKYPSDDSEYGNRLYVVRAEMRSREAGKYIGAALGWYQLEDGRGVFVEHEAIDATMEGLKAVLQQEVTHSIMDLCHFRGYRCDMEKIKMHSSVMQVKSQPASVLVVAVYKSEPW